MRHIHLDLVGGLSGDMFISVMLDCFPANAAALEPLLEQAGFKDLVRLESEPFDDGTLTGTRFRVLADKDAEGHHHRHYSEIRRIIGESALPEGVQTVALSIFHLIAEVEAEIHGKTVESVAFHEVGAWDSIADIVCAAYLIDAADASFSVSRVPLGAGQVKTAHGMLPIPAPATARLLEGFEFFTDGLEGERVTPTGAAILKFLAPAREVPPGLSLKCSGYGFGTKKFPGISNTVRALVFEGEDAPWVNDQVLQLAFELDDQSAEEVAAFLDRLRQQSGVLDVVQYPVFGKKGRQSFSIRVLAEPAQEQAVLTACFAQSKTLGIRRELLQRAVLKRQVVVVHYKGTDYRVKIADRPGGATAKAEMDDVISSGGSIADRAQIEAMALADFNR